jgi:hypothetical protein
MKSISFTGGLGAQIISTAAYHYLMLKGEKVTADFSYFTQPPHNAIQGERSDISIWEWELDRMGIFQENFERPKKEHLEIIHDGFDKFRYGLLGLSNETIRSMFRLEPSIESIRREVFNEGQFVCVHIRRGDYINVASHLVPDSEFLSVLESTSDLCKNLLIISDSPLSNFLATRISSLQLNKTRIIIGGDPLISHGLMRLSDILICSNSQFSVTAAALRRKTQLSILPSQHDGPHKSATNGILGMLRSFQIFTGISGISK